MSNTLNATASQIGVMKCVRNSNTDVYSAEHIRRCPLHAIMLGQMLGEQSERARIEREAETYIAKLHSHGALAEASGAEDVLAIVRGFDLEGELDT